MGVLASGRAGGRLRAGFMILVVCIVACAPGASRPASNQQAATRLPPLAPSVAVAPNLHILRNPIPFPFEANYGRAGPEVAFLLHAGALRAAFSASGVTYALLAADPADPPASFDA